MCIGNTQIISKNYQKNLVVYLSPRQPFSLFIAQSQSTSPCCHLVEVLMAPSSISTRPLTKMTFLCSMTSLHLQGLTLHQVLRGTLGLRLPVVPQLGLPYNHPWPPVPHTGDRQVSIPGPLWRGFIVSGVDQASSSPQPALHLSSSLSWRSHHPPQ